VITPERPAVSFAIASCAPCPPFSSRSGHLVITDEIALLRFMSPGKLLGHCHGVGRVAEGHLARHSGSPCHVLDLGQLLGLAHRVARHPAARQNNSVIRHRRSNGLNFAPWRARPWIGVHPTSGEDRERWYSFPRSGHAWILSISFWHFGKP